MSTVGSGGTPDFSSRLDKVLAGYDKELSHLDESAIDSRLEHLTSSQYELFEKIVRHKREGLEPPALTDYEIVVLGQLEKDVGIAQRSEVRDPNDFDTSKRTTAEQKELFQRIGDLQGDLNKIKGLKNLISDEDKGLIKEFKSLKNAADLSVFSAADEEKLEALENKAKFLIKTLDKGVSSKNPEITVSVPKESLPKSSKEGHLKSVAHKIVNFFKEIFSSSPKPTLEEGIEHAEGFLKSKPAGKFTKADSKEMSAKGLERGTFKNVGMGIMAQANRGKNQHRLEGFLTESRETLIGAGKEASRREDPFLMEKIENGFVSLENNLKPFLKNPQYAAFYAHDSREHARFVHTQKIPALALKHYRNEDGEFGRKVDEKLAVDPSLSLMGAIQSVLAEKGGLESVPGAMEQLKLAHQLEEKAMLWAKYASDRGKPLGALIAAEMYFSYGDWRTENREKTFDIAMKFAEKVRDKGGKAFAKEGYVAIGALNEKRMHLALKDGNNSEFRLAGQLAVSAYKDAGPGGLQGLYNLFQMGSVDAGKAIVEAIAKRGISTDRPNDINLLFVLADSGISGAKELLAKLPETYRPHERIGTSKDYSQPKTLQNRVVEAAKRHEQNKELWTPPRAPAAPAPPPSKPTEPLLKEQRSEPAKPKFDPSLKITPQGPKDTSPEDDLRLKQKQKMNAAIEASKRQPSLPDLDNPPPDPLMEQVLDEMELQKTEEMHRMGMKDDEFSEMLAVSKEEQDEFDDLGVDFSDVNDFMAQLTEYYVENDLKNP